MGTCDCVLQILDGLSLRVLAVTMDVYLVDVGTYQGQQVYSYSRRHGWEPLVISSKDRSEGWNRRATAVRLSDSHLPVKLSWITR